VPTAVGFAVEVEPEVGVAAGVAPLGIGLGVIVGTALEAGEFEDEGVAVAEGDGLAAGELLEKYQTAPAEATSTIITTIIIIQVSRLAITRFFLHQVLNQY
jgi:hypothetical protein